MDGRTLPSALAPPLLRTNLIHVCYGMLLINEQPLKHIISGTPCPTVVPPSNGFVSATTAAYPDQITVNCSEGHYLDLPGNPESITIQCNHTGEYNQSVPTACHGMYL